MPDDTLDDAALLQRLDTAIADSARLHAELRQLRDAVVARKSAELAAANGADTADDFAPTDLIEVSTAVEIFNRPADTLRLYCRQGDGVKRGGRWLLSPRKVRRRLNGE